MTQRTLAFGSTFGGETANGGKVSSDAAPSGSRGPWAARSRPNGLRVGRSLGRVSSDASARGPGSLRATRSTGKGGLRATQTGEPGNSRMQIQRRNGSNGGKASSDAASSGSPGLRATESTTKRPSGRAVLGGVSSDTSARGSESLRAARSTGKGGLRAIRTGEPGNSRMQIQRRNGSNGGKASSDAASSGSPGLRATESTTKRPSGRAVLGEVSSDTSARGPESLRAARSTGKGGLRATWTGEPGNLRAQAHRWKGSGGKAPLGYLPSGL